MPALALALLLLTPTAPAPPDGAPRWTVLTPETATSEGGATFETLPDRSIFVSGPKPAEDAYELELFTDLSGITALRLEALTDERLPRKGAGRAHNGNFVVSVLTLEARSKFAKRWVPVPLENATASFSQSGRDVATMLDGNTGSGWSVHPEMATPQTAVCETSRDLSYDTGTWLRVRMEFRFGSAHALGRFRLAVTDAARPVRAEGSADARAWHEVQSRIPIAQAKGIDWLLDHQELDGSWAFKQEEHRTGMTGLAVYALLKAGLPNDHPSVRRGAEFLRSHDSVKTYSMACHIMALVTLGAEVDREKVQLLCDELVSWQDKGGYAYPTGSLDLSNTQYAALALRTAAKAGHKVPRPVWNRFADYALKLKEEHRNPYAACGFGYHGPDAPSGSMTAAGVGILAIVDEQMRRKRGDVKTGIQQGLQWLADHWDVRRNVKPSAEEGEQHRYLGYYLYGLERVGGLLGVGRIGEHDWYREGASFLTESQKKEGSWAAPRWGEEQPNTCFALLFLSRATGATTGVSGDARSRSYGADDPDAPFSILASGDSPLAMWVTSYGAETRSTLVHEGEESPRVAKVVWAYAGDRTRDEPIRFATVEGDPGRPAGPARFAARHLFPRTGVFEVWAEAHVAGPGADAGDPATWTVLESKAIEVRITDAPDPMLVRYAGDARRNVLTRTRVLARASSRLGDGNAESLVHDDLQSRGWVSADDDPLPSIVLDLERQVRADRVLLSHARTTDANRSARARRVKVEINRRETFEVEMDPDDRRKTVIALPKPLTVRRLVVQVLEATPSASDKRGIGFAEIELQLDTKGN